MASRHDCAQKGGTGAHLVPQHSMSVSGASRCSSPTMCRVTTSTDDQPSQKMQKADSTAISIGIDMLRSRVLDRALSVTTSPSQ